MDIPPIVEDSPNGDTGELYPGTSPPFETKDYPPFFQSKWNAESAGSKVASMVSKGVTITLKVTPYAIMIYLFAPAEVKYAARQYARYIPWAIKYAVWWMKQNA